VPAADRARATVGVLGELMITVGVVVVLFAFYTLFWTGVQTADAQKDLKDQLTRAAPTPTPTAPAAPAVVQETPAATPAASTGSTSVGDAYALMRIPRLGASWEWAVVSGVDVADLRRGPGHYPWTAAPGATGNFAVAGHRATYGEPFAYLDRLRPGDDIVVEREGSTYRYVVTSSFVTGPDDAAVLEPVPSQPGVEASQSVITLTTCDPRWSSARRLIVHGTLAEVT
jgi:sortase A